jgi:alginate O-acetyltransferase complex protein AlgI
LNFHSVQFLAFLAVVLPLFWLLANRRQARTGLLLVASLFFYGSYTFWFLALIIYSTFLDWVCGNQIHAARERGDLDRARRFLWVSLAGNLGVLAFFKYTDWLLRSIAQGLSLFGIEWDAVAWKVASMPRFLLNAELTSLIVPVGISFYTFQTLSYTIDIYRGQLKPAKSFTDFSLFVAFFPQLVAGPIVRAIEFIPQLEFRPRLSKERLREGLWRMNTGLLKKIGIADMLGQHLVDPVYAQPDEYSAVVHLLALYAFAFQIYFDFSGYSDIAIGTSKLVGFDLTENFVTPYRSRSVREFWRRWHISLSSWVRDYIYFPLGGSRGGENRVRRNLLITMLVIGVWHGASILWVLYGLMQGGVMIVERIFERARGGKEFATNLPRSLMSWALTFHFIVFSCLFIRARSWDELVGMVSVTGDTGPGAINVWAYWALGFGALTHFWPPSITEWFHRRFLSCPELLVGLLTGLVAGLVALLVVGQTPYIYFQF